MNMEDKIKQVMDVEKKAEKILGDTDKKAAGIVEAARNKARDMLENTGESLKKDNSQKLKEAESSMQEKKDRILKKGEAEKLKIKKSAEKNIGRAADLVIGLLKKVG